MAEGVEGLPRDKSRLPGIALVADSRAAAIVAMTLKPPHHEATHSTVRALAKAVGLAASTAQKILKTLGLAPHRWRSFKLSNDPAFAEKLHAVVGLYVAPPAHAVVLSIDEKSQIEALDRTQPGLPLKKGRGAALTHDYKRRGTTKLFAALNILDGTVTGRNMQRHRNQEFMAEQRPRWQRKLLWHSTTAVPSRWRTRRFLRRISGRCRIVGVRQVLRSLVKRRWGSGCNDLPGIGLDVQKGREPVLAGKARRLALSRVTSSLSRSDASPVGEGKARKGRAQVPIG